jgi:F-type H+-transporting ATPase subunit b
MNVISMMLFAEEGAAGPASPFEVNFGLFFWTWLVFIALYFVLKKYAWPAIVQATEERERKIGEQLGEAARLNAEARTALDESRQAIADARANAQSMVAEARSAAEKERAAVLAKAKQEQEEILARARREISAEKDKALVELRREAVDLSLAAAAKLMESRLDSEADRKFIEDYLDSVGNVH